MFVHFKLIFTNSVLCVQGTLESMLKCVEDECPHIVSCEDVKSDIRKTCHDKIYLPLEFVETCIMDQAGTDIMNKTKYDFIKL